MLTHIHIRDFAIVAQIDLSMDPGMTVFTGETGAGKSIVVGALALALGDRADAQMVRPGGRQSEIAVSFDIHALEAIRHWLGERGLEAGHECLIRRTVSNDSRTRAYINDAPVSLQTLRELGQMLVDVHGQHEHQSLLRRDVQRQLLDDYGGHAPLPARVADAFHAWTEAQRRLEEETRHRGEREARADLLRHQVAELEASSVAPGELNSLQEEHCRLANVYRLTQGTQAVLEALYDHPDHAAVNVMNRALSELQQLGDLDSALTDACQLLAEGAVHVQEASNELRRYLGRLEPDPERLDQVQQRIAHIQELARKHRVDPETLPDLTRQLAEEWTAVEGAQASLQALAETVADGARRYRELAAELSGMREHAARTLERQVSQDMQRLGMPGGRFAVTLEPLDRPSPGGTEGVDFHVSANPGHPLMPLGKVASGGELARISLAIHVATARSGLIPTLVFDEVDVGIGGRVAETVGQHLLAVAQSRQVLCITHLPQVAALAHQHIQVTKDARGQAARADARHLSAEERVQELARMAGGAEVTPRTLAHARDLLDRAQHAHTRGTREFLG